MRYSILLLVVLFIAVIGCSEKSQNPEDSQNQNPATGNTPSYVQEMLKKYVTENDDALANDWLSNFDSNAIDIACNSEAYAVTFLWGDKFSDVSATAITDWSGSLSLNAVGSVTPKFTIDFEPGQDSILITDSPTVTMWASKISNDLDGISFMVTVRTDVEYFAAPMLTFQTGPITLEFYMADLISLDVRHPALAGRTADSLVDSWIFAGYRGAVDCVWRAGRKLVEGGRHRARDAVGERYRETICRFVG